MFGPADIFWQFPMERLAGILKSKAHNRSLANRNISLASLYIKQMHLLPLVCRLKARPHALESLPYQPSLESYVPELMGFDQDTDLTGEDLTDLAYYYTVHTPGSSFASIRRGINPKVKVYKRARCYSDREYVGPFSLGSVLKTLGTSHRAQDKDDYWVRLSYADRHGSIIEDIGRVMFYISTQWRQQQRLLARIEIFDNHRTDGLWEITRTIHSVVWTDISCLHEPIGLVSSGSSRYAVGKRTGLW